MVDDSPIANFDVAIVGGGICGLATACGLYRAGVPVRVYEAAPSFKEIGAGVGLGPNAIHALRGLGVLQEVIAHSDDKDVQRRGFEFYTAVERELIYKYPTDPERHKGLGIHRASMLDALSSILPSSLAYFNKRCTSVTPATSSGGKAVIFFADGSKVEADVVLGCDGIKSIVRNALGQINSKPVFMNTTAYRGLIPISLLEGFEPEELYRAPRMYAGDDKHIVCFTVKGGSVLNVVLFCCDRTVPYGSIAQPPGLTWVSPCNIDEVLHEFDGWCPQVQSIIKAITNPTKWTLYALQPPLENFSIKNVALVGDAAHAMLPHLGAGAGQGLEDAYIMAKLLSHPRTTRANLEAVLEAYSNSRVPRANQVQKASTIAGEVWEGKGEHGNNIDARRQDTQGIWDWIWDGYDLEEEFQKIVQRI